MVIWTVQKENEIEFADWVDEIPESEIRRILRYSPKYYFAGGKPGILPVKTFHTIIGEILEEEKILLNEKSVEVLDNYLLKQSIEKLGHVFFGSSS